MLLQCVVVVVYCSSIIVHHWFYSTSLLLHSVVPLVDFTISTTCNFCYNASDPSQMASENNEFVCRTSRHNCSASYSLCIEFWPPVRKPWGSFLLQKYLQHFEMLTATLKDSLGFLKSKLRSISFNLYTSRSFTLWWLDMFVDIIFCCWIWLSLLCSLHFSVLSVCVREHICILFVPREGSGLIPSGTPPQTAHHWRDNPLPCTLHTTHNTL